MPLVVPPGVTQIVTPAEVRTHLVVDSTTATDAELQGFIDGATAIIQNPQLAGQVIGLQVTNEEHRTDGHTVLLYNHPVLQVTSITEYWTKTPFAITVYDSPDLTTTYAATLDGDSGRLTRWVSGVPANWQPVIHVTYLAGQASVRGDVHFATLEAVRLLWTKAKGITATEYPVSLSTQDIAYLRNLLDQVPYAHRVLIG